MQPWYSLHQILSPYSFCTYVHCLSHLQPSAPYLYLGVQVVSSYPPVYAAPGDKDTPWGHLQPSPPDSKPALASATHRAEGNLIDSPFCMTKVCLCFSVSSQPVGIFEIKGCFCNLKLSSQMIKSTCYLFFSFRSVAIHLQYLIQIFHDGLYEMGEDPDSVNHLALDHNDCKVRGSRTI